MSSRSWGFFHNKTMINNDEIDYWQSEYPDLDRSEIIEILQIMEKRSGTSTGSCSTMEPPTQSGTSTTNSRRSGCSDEDVSLQTE